MSRVLGAVCLVALAASAGCGGIGTGEKRACTGASIPSRLAPTTAAPVAPSFGPPLRYAIDHGSNEGSPGEGRAIAVSDLNRDGRLDLVTANWDANDVSVLLNRGKGTFEPRRDYGTGRGPNEVAVGDLNCDGAPDIVTTAGSSDQMITLPSGDVSSRTYDYVSVLLNRGDGTFNEKRDFPTGETPGSVAIGDFDRDGYRDLAVGVSGGVSVLLNDHEGGFNQRTDYSTGGSASPMSVSAADVNGDGRLDLEIASSDGDIASILLNRGGGHFSRGPHYLSGVGSAWLTAGDLNADGAVDLALVRQDQSDELEEEGVTLEPDYVSTLTGRGDGSFVPARPFFQTGGYAELVGPPTIVDLTGDGMPDLLVPRSDENLGIVSLFPNDRSGELRDERRIDYLVGGQEDADAIAVGDLDGDGRPDLVTVNFGSHKLSVFFNRPGRCTVQDVSGSTQHVVGRLSHGLTPEGASRALARGNCRVGTIRYAYSKFGAARGVVIGQQARFGAVLPGSAKVDLLVSKGSK
jgi:FG-GAP-like repeat